MNRKQKIKYLEQYKKLKDRFEYLDNRLKDPNTINYHDAKTTVHQSLEDKIHERDKAYEDMIYTSTDWLNMICYWDISIQQTCLTMRLLKC